FLKKIEITSTPNEAQELYLQAGKEFLLKENKAKANDYFDKIINSETEVLDKSTLSEALFYKEEYAKAKTILNEILLKSNIDIDALAKLAICNFKLGNLVEAENNLKTLENLRTDYQF